MSRITDDYERRTRNQELEEIHAAHNRAHAVGLKREQEYRVRAENAESDCKRALALLGEFRLQMLADEEQVKRQLADLTQVMEQLKTTHALATSLAKALREAWDQINWMSGSPDFGPKGICHPAWMNSAETRDSIVAVLNAAGAGGLFG